MIEDPNQKVVRYVDRCGVSVRVHFILAKSAIRALQNA